VRYYQPHETIAVTTISVSRVRSDSTPLQSAPAAPLLTFFIGTFAVTWICWISIAEAHISEHAPVRSALELLGTSAPALVALGLVAKNAGRTGIQDLIRRLLQWQVGARWYLLAVFYMPAIKLTAALAHRTITGSWPQFGKDPWYLLVIAIIFSTPVQSGEEIGWRGFALPRLLERMGFARASILLGVIWAVWHLPVFFIPGADKYGQSFPVWALGVTALSVAMAWIYVHTGGSLLLTMLMHAAVNNTSGIVPSATIGASNPFSFKASLMLWTTTGLMWIPVTYFLIQMSRAELRNARA